MKMTRTLTARIACGLLAVAVLAGCRPGSTESEIVPTLIVTLAAPIQTLDPPTPMTSPAPPTLAPTATPGLPPPDPTTPPLPVSLTAEQALEAALTYDRSANSRMPISAEELATAATVSLHDGRAAADAALGIQSGYAEEIEADAGQVWLIALPGPVWGVAGPGFSPWAVYDGIAYQFSARTGSFLGLHAGPTLPALALLFVRDDDLYRTDVGGQVVEQLTTGGQLGWGMAANDDDWRIAAMSQPPRVSPDGYHVAFAPRSTTVVVAGVQRPLLAAPLEFPGTGVMAWSPDSRRLAFAVDENDAERAQLAVYDLYTQTTTPLLAEITPNIRNLAWSPDGARIAFGCCFEEDYDAAGEYLGSTTGELRAITLSTGQVDSVGTLQSSIGGGTEGFCWAADNRLIGYEANSSAAPVSCSTPPDYSIAPDGRRFYLSTLPADDSGAIAYELVVEDATGNELRRSTLAQNMWPAAWSPDGRTIFLDHIADLPSIWRLGADGAGEPELLIENAYLLAVVPAWQ